MATVTVNKEPGEAMTSGLASSSVARSLSRAVDKYYEVPLETEECIPVTQATKEGVPPRHNRSWRTLNCPEEVKFMTDAALAAGKAEHGGIAHMIRSALNEEQAVVALEAAGLRDRLQYMLPCMLVSPLAASTPTTSFPADLPTNREAECSQNKSRDKEASTGASAGPLGEGVECDLADLSSELPELGFSFDDAAADVSPIVAAADENLWDTTSERQRRPTDFVAEPEASEEPEIRGSRAPPLEKLRSHYVAHTESPVSSEPLRLVQSAVEPRSGAGMDMESVQSLEGFNTLLLADLSKSLRAGKMSAEIRDLAAIIGSAISEQETVSSAPHASLMAGTVPTGMPSSGAANRYQVAQDDTLDASAILFDFENGEDVEGQPSSALRHDVLCSSFEEWSTSVNAFQVPPSRRNQIVARSVSLAFLRWCATATDPLPVDIVTGKRGGVATASGEPSSLKDGEFDKGDGEKLVSRVSLAFREWLDSGVASETSPEVSVARPSPEAAEYVVRSVSRAFQRWCAKAVNGAEGGHEEFRNAEASFPRTAHPSNELLSSSTSGDQLSQPNCEPATFGDFEGPCSSDYSPQRRNVSTTFRDWCRSIDFASSAGSGYRSSSHSHQISLPTHFCRAEQQQPRASSPEVSRHQIPSSLSKMLTGSRGSTMTLSAVIASGSGYLLSPQTVTSEDDDSTTAQPGPAAKCKDALLRSLLLDPVLSVMQDDNGDVPLRSDEIRNLRLYMVKEITTLIGKDIPDQVQRQLIAVPACACIVSSPAHRMTRCQMRIADSPMPGLGAGVEMSLRHYFYSIGHCQLSPYSCCQLDGSEVLCGAGPNGGHTGVSLKSVATANVARLNEFSRSPKSLCHKRKEVAVAIRLHGNEINASAGGELAYSRDREIAAFFTELLEMQVRCVVACGFTCAHDECNPKTLIELQEPYFDPRKVLPSSYIRARGVHPSYKKGCGRDFFNYFGSSNGDDGIRWRSTTDPEDGRAARVARFAGLVVTSTLLEKDDTCAMPGTPYRVGVYRVRVSWAVGHCCLRRNMVAILKVVHIQAWDQSPAQLTRRQVSMLYNAVSGNEPGATGLGFKKDLSVGRVMIHCAAGIGRTGNIAYGLAELLCQNVPASPLEKLLWLRRSRPEAIQTPEQLVDGIQLSGMLLQEVLYRMECKRNEGRESVSSVVPAEAM